MEPRLNRTAVFVNLAAFLCFGIFCIATQAPLIQQDILKRSQDALLTNRLPIRGLAVEGRDVVLSGIPESPITSVRARTAVEQVAGVRMVRIRFLPIPESIGPAAAQSIGPGGTSNNLDGAVSLAPATPEQQREVQSKIDQLLDAQPISFRPDAALLSIESEVVLDKVVTLLLEAPNLYCEIRGYDSQPREARQKWVLALQRALSTEDYLVTKGIAEWRLSAHAFQVGEGTEGRKTDRIVDFVVRAR